MNLRDATFDDMEALMPLAREAHLKSWMRDMPMNEAIVQRNFVVAMQFDDGYAKVVMKDGEVVGGLVGLIADNHFGIRHAQDLFCFSRGGTEMLIGNFLGWAKERGAEFVHMTDISMNLRYQKLCQTLGLERAGVNLMRIL